MAFKAEISATRFSSGWGVERVFSFGCVCVCVFIVVESVFDSHVMFLCYMSERAATLFQCVALCTIYKSFFTRSLPILRDVSFCRP